MTVPARKKAAVSFNSFAILRAWLTGAWLFRKASAAKLTGASWGGIFDRGHYFTSEICVTGNDCYCIASGAICKERDQKQKKSRYSAGPAGRRDIGFWFYAALNGRLFRIMFDAAEQGMRRCSVRQRGDHHEQIRNRNEQK